MRVEILWFIGFNGGVHWSLCWRGLGVTLTGLVFVTSPITMMTPCTPSKISTHHWVVPRNSVSNRAPHLLRPILVKRSCENTHPCRSLTPSVNICGLSGRPVQSPKWNIKIKVIVFKKWDLHYNNIDIWYWICTNSFSFFGSALSFLCAALS